MDATQKTVTVAAMQELWTAYRQRAAGADMNPTFTNTHQSLVTNVAAGVTNYYLTNSAVVISNDISAVRFTKQPAGIILNGLFGSTPLWNYFVTTNSLLHATNWAYVANADVAAWAPGGVDTNAIGLPEQAIVADHGIITNPAAVVWVYRGTATMDIASYGDLDSKNAAIGRFQRYGMGAVSNSVASLIYRPASTNDGALSLTLAGWTATGVETSETVNISANETQVLDHCYLTENLILEGAAGDMPDWADPALTLDSGTVSTGAQFVLRYDHFDKRVALARDFGSIFINSPFWKTRPLLNAAHYALDNMRVCERLAHLRFVDGYQGDGLTLADASNNWARLPTDYEYADKPEGGGEQGHWFGFSFAGVYGEPGTTNKHLYATEWAVTNAPMTQWTGQTWQAQWQLLPRAPIGSDYDDFGMGFSNAVWFGGSWETVTNATYVFADTFGETNMPPHSYGDDKGVDWDDWYSVPHGVYRPIRCLLRLDTDTNYICNP
jgi:hypothetical protein